MERSPTFGPNGKERLNPSPETPISPEEFLEEIDFNEVNFLFDELERKSGVKIHGKWVDKENVFFIENESLNSKDEESDEFEVGGYVNSTDQIFLNWNVITKMHENMRPEDAGTHVLIHEVAHVRSRIQLSQIESEVTRRILANASDDNDTRLTIGLSEVVYSTKRFDEDEYRKRIHKFGTRIDEAITEEIAVEVFTQYLLRKGKTGTLDNAKADHLASQSYLGERILFHGILDALSHSLEIPKEVLWTGFVREYFNGEQSATLLMLQMVDILGADLDEMVLGRLWLHEPTDKDLGMAFKDSEAFKKAIEATVEKFDKTQLKNELGFT